VQVGFAKAGEFSIVAVMGALIPTKAQWKRWTLANKLTCVGTYVVIISFVVAIVFFL